MRRSFVILAAALSLTLTACDKAGNSSKTGIESSGESTSNVPENREHEGLVQLGGIEPCVTAEGMYYIDDSPYSDKDFAHIMYIDFATKQETYLCSDSSCDHNNERCTSCIDDSELFGMNTSLFAYNGYLYFLNLYHTSEGSFGTNAASAGLGKQELYRMNLDGTNRELIYSFDKNLSVANNVIGDGDALWFSVHEEYVEKSSVKDMYYVAAKDKAMIRLDLSQLEIVKQIPVKDAGSVSLEYILCTGDKFIFSGVEYPDGMTKMEYIEKCFGFRGDSESFAPTPEEIELENRCRYVYYTLDRVVDKVTKPLYQTETNINIAPFIYNGELCIPFKGMEARDVNTRINVVTGETEEFYAAEGYIITGGVFADKYSCKHFEDDSISTVSYIDAKTGELSECRLGIEPLGMPVEPITVYDGRALVYYNDYRSEKNGGSYPEYAFLTLDDLFNGRPNYEPIKMIHESE